MHLKIIIDNKSLTRTILKPLKQLISISCLKFNYTTIPDSFNFSIQTLFNIDNIDNAAILPLHSI